MDDQDTLQAILDLEEKIILMDREIRKLETSIIESTYRPQLRDYYGTLYLNAGSLSMAAFNLKSKLAKRFGFR